MAKEKANRPPIGINPNIPVPVQRDLRKVAQAAFDAQDQAAANTTALLGKVSNTPEGLLQIAQFLSQQLQAGGQFPLSIANLPGQAAQPQLAIAPVVQSLPLRPNPLAAPGQLVYFNGQIWRFSGTGGGASTSQVQPGVWQPTSGVILEGTHAQRLANYPAANYAPGTMFYETDTTITYIVYSGNWVYQSGIYYIAQSAIAYYAATLGAHDTGVLISVTDFAHTLEWGGSSFGWGPDGDDGVGDIRGKLIDPSPTTGWHLCDGTAGVKYLKSDGTTGTITLPDLVTNPAYLKFGSPASAMINAPVAPSLTMDSYTPAGTISSPLVMNPYTPAGTISTPTLSMNSYTPSGTVSQPTFTGNLNTTSAPAGTISFDPGAATPVSAASITHNHTVTPSGTVSQPTFTGNAATLTGTISTPTFTGTPATLTGTISTTGEPQNIVLRPWFRC